MAVYLDKFVLPLEKEESLVIKRMAHNGGVYGYIDNVYPCGIFSENQLREIDFKNITIFYGGNGSGKSTLLNLIANKMKIKRIAPYNNSELFDDYVDECEYRMGYDDEGFSYRALPQDSRIITSDDIFDYMLNIRENNNDIADETEVLRQDAYNKLKFGETIKLRSFENYEEFRLQVLSRQKSLSRRKFMYKVAGKEMKLNSNGETAIDYFNEKIKNDCFYCLDEPENSLSPMYQQKLVEMIARKARYCGCQFVIATHSPFVLSLEGAKIYDLDACPVDIKNWWELENTKTYHEFFEKNRHLFKKN